MPIGGKAYYYFYVTHARKTCTSVQTGMRVTAELGRANNLVTLGDSAVVRSSLAE